MLSILRSLVSSVPAFRNHAFSPSPAGRTRQCLRRLQYAFVVMAAILSCAVGARADAATTTTTLSITSASGAVATTGLVGTAVTFTAQVMAGGTAVTAGQVTFCDAALASCGYSTSLATAQLTSAGTATVKLLPKPGPHTYKAVFLGTTSNASSASAVQTLTATASFITDMSATASATSPYTLTAMLHTDGPQYLLTGTVSFVDSVNKLSLGQAALSPAPVQSMYLATSNTSYPTKAGAESILTADFNGDGKPDVAVPFSSEFEDGGTMDGVSIFLGNGDDTFTAGPVVNLPTGAIVTALVAADFNADGKMDLVTVNAGTGNVTFLLGKGDGSFTVGASLTVGDSVTSAVTADFNRDGNADIAITNYSGNLNILLGKGDGTFTATTKNLGAERAFSLTAADLNGDGIADLAVANGDSSLSILLGNGDGTFKTGSPANTIDTPVNVVSGDFNADGKTDLAVVNSGGSDTSIGILIGKGDGTFTAGTVPSYDISTDTTTGNYLAAADFDGDGKTDIAVGDNNSLQEYLSNGDGSFSLGPSATGATSGPNYYTIAVADFDGEGYQDIATSNSDTNQLSIYLTLTQVQATATLANVLVPGTGQHGIVATYSGNADIVPTTRQVTVAAAQLATKLSLTASSTTPVFGAQILLTATLAPSSYQTLLTDGETVTFLNGTTSIGSSTLKSGVATLNISSLPLGSDSITASYAGDDNFAKSVSTAETVVVTSATPMLTLSPTSLTFAPQSVGTASAPQTVTLTNSGTAALTVASIAASGAFAETNTCGTSVAAGANCQISVTYAPTTAGSSSGAIVITDNAAGSPQSVALSGTGVALSVTASTSQLTISSPGGSATDNLQIAPGGGFTGSVNLTCAVAFTGTGTPHDAPSCSLSPSSVTISSGAATSTLTVSSTAATSGLGGLFVPSGTALAALALCGFVPRRKWRGMVVALLLVVAMITAATGCGGSSKSKAPSDPGTSAGSYTVTVTATGGAVTTTTSIPLTVQ